jgi:hypothetical protein
MANGAGAVACNRYAPIASKLLARLRAAGVICRSGYFVKTSASSWASSLA